MKKYIKIVAVILSLILLAGCGVFGLGNVSKVKVDYGQSEINSQEEMEKAANVVFAEFRTWQGCKLEKLSYAGDERSTDELNYYRNYTPGVEYDECIVFTSDFHVSDEGFDVFEPGENYSDWSWILCRESAGEWKIITGGYG